MEPRIRARRQAALAEMLPLTDPRFNLREISKQLLLLEDHLLHQNKVCPDCIRKHLLTVEALAEEATSLNSGQVEPPEMTENLAKVARIWLMGFTDGRAPLDLASDVRKVRKMLVAKVFDPPDMQIRVAMLLWYRQTGCSHQPLQG